MRSDGGIQAQHGEHHLSQRSLQGVGTVVDRLARGLAGCGEQVTGLVGAVLPTQIASQFGLDGVGLGGKPGAADSSGGAFDGLGERRFVLGELLQDVKLGVDDDHRIKHVGPLIALDQIDGRGARQFALVGFGHRLEGEGDQANLAQRVEGGLGAARCQRFRAAYQAEGGDGLFGAVIEDGQVFRLEVGHRFALFVADDEVEQDFIDVGLDRGTGGLLGGRRQWSQQGSHQQCGR